MDKPISENCRNILYWMTSDDISASVGRARGDVPISPLIDELSESEAAYVKEILFRRFQINWDVSLITALTYMQDTRIVPILKKRLKEYKEKSKLKIGNFTYEVELCKASIKALSKKHK